MYKRLLDPGGDPRARTQERPSSKAPAATRSSFSPLLVDPSLPARPLAVAQGIDWPGKGRGAVNHHHQNFEDYLYKQSPKTPHGLCVHPSTLLHTHTSHPSTCPPRLPTSPDPHPHPSHPPSPKQVLLPGVGPPALHGQHGLPRAAGGGLRHRRQGQPPIRPLAGTCILEGG